MTSLVKIHRKGQMTLPVKLRSLAGISESDMVEAAFHRGKIVITPRLVIDRSKFPTADVEYTPAQRRIIDARLAKSDEDIKRGRVYGPFNTAEEMAASIEANIKKASGSKEEIEARTMRLAYTQKSPRDAEPETPFPYARPSTSRRLSWSPISTTLRSTLRNTASLKTSGRRGSTAVGASISKSPAIPISLPGSFRIPNEGAHLGADAAAKRRRGIRGSAARGPASLLIATSRWYSGSHHYHGPKNQSRFQAHLRQPVAQRIARQPQQARGLALVAVRAAQRLADEILLVLIERHALGQETVRLVAARGCAAPFRA